MWIFTQTGFYSIVQKPEDVQGGTLTVRARSLSDILNFCDDCAIDPHEIDKTSGTDYPFRVRVSHRVLADWLANSAYEIDYPNFKDRVHQTLGAARAAIYLRIWSYLGNITHRKS